MKIPRKSATVGKKVSDEQLQNHKRWCAFLAASSVPFEDLTEEWLDVFSEQANILTASETLSKLVDIAIERDEKK